MTLRYIDEHGKLVTIENITFFSVVSDSVDNYILYYLTDDSRHELVLPVTIPYFIDTF